MPYPTRRHISRPGPLVTAMASTSPTLDSPASFTALLTALSMFTAEKKRIKCFSVYNVSHIIDESYAPLCVSMATPGTIPPKRWCISYCEKTTFDRICPSERTIATPVSSHDVSMPRTRYGFEVSGRPDLAPASLSRTYLSLKSEYPLAFPIPSRIDPPLNSLVCHIKSAFFVVNLVRNAIENRKKIHQNASDNLFFMSLQSSVAVRFWNYFLL